MEETVETPQSVVQLIKKIKYSVSEGSIDVPMLPEVAGKVVRLTQDPDSDAAELAQLTQSDQPLAAHVMRVANSAAYSPNASLVSLQQAITRLGMRVISEIALAASINSELFNTPGYEKYVQHILNSSLAAALWSKETARMCRKNVEAAFLSGLLNDIGRPVAVQTALTMVKEQNIDITRDLLLSVEKQTKRDIGLKVLEAWEMPTAVTNIVAYFDHYDVEHPGQLQTKIVVAGTTIARHLFREDGEESELSKDELIRHPIFADINLYPDEIEQLLDKEDIVKSTMETMAQ